MNNAPYSLDETVQYLLGHLASNHELRHPLDEADTKLAGITVRHPLVQASDDTVRIMRPECEFDEAALREALGLPATTPDPEPPPIDGLALWVGSAAPSEEQRLALEALDYRLPNPSITMGYLAWWGTVVSGPMKDSPGAAYDHLAICPASALFFPGPVPPWLLSEMAFRTAASMDDAGYCPPGIEVYAAGYSTPIERPNPDTVNAPDVNRGFTRWYKVGEIFENDLGPTS